MPQPPTSARTLWLRTVMLALAAGVSLAAGAIYLDLIGGNRSSALDWLRTVLLVVTGFWLVWGGAAGILGALAPAQPPARTGGRPLGRSIILVPIYNEDPFETFSRIAAMNQQLVEQNLADRFHFAILSDTSSVEIAAQEILAFEHLIQEPHASNRIFYRRRERNIGKKAGNIEDFVSHSGGAYDYAVVLDADSLMEAGTLCEMALRMDRDPELGLLQTVPVVIRAGSIFGRLMAFSASYLSPYFARGSAALHGSAGPYWGHNAIIRLRAFASCCGLPVLSGKSPYGGHILSHDYVEAALLVRGGWKVQLAPDLGGSFEEGPENLIEYAKRDRRWCQGNLQHRRLLLAPGLNPWSRFTLMQGVMAYLASPLWLVLVGASLLAAFLPDRGGERWSATPWLIAAGVAAALLLPKLAILLRGALDGHNARFGNSLFLICSVLAEIIVSTFMAPVMLALQSRAVFQILLGRDGGWPATERNATAVPFRTACAASWWVVLIAVATIGLFSIAMPAYLPWLLPLAIPAMLAPVTIWLTSMGDGNPALQNIFAIPTERQPTQVMQYAQRIQAGWTHPARPDLARPKVSAAHARA